MSSLYLEHFGLNKPPFQITPDLDFFFSGGRRGDILSALLHVASHDEGIITLVAEVGSGKTLLARLMISRLGADVCAVYLANPCFSRDEIIVAIARDLGLPGLVGSIEGKLAALHQELLRRHAEGQRVLLVIDEAHAMPVESLEEVRLLSNLETGQHKLVNIMLFGQPELDALLAEPRLRQVRDRVIHRFELPPLQTQEAAAYIDHRLRAAGWGGAGLFTSSALTRLVKASAGRARRINLLADKALLAAYAQGGRSVDTPHVNAAVTELPFDYPAQPGSGLDRWRLARWSIALAAATSVGILGTLGWSRMAATPVTPVARISPPMPAQATAAEPNRAAPVSAPAVLLVDKHFESILARTQTQLRKINLDGYTIQLAALPSSTSPDRYMLLATTQLDESMVYAQYSVYKGKTYMSVYFGNFDSFRAAAVVMDGLPAALRANRPMVRTWTKIKGDQAP
jgi:MSHA biogenesis protein MshM